MESIITMKIYNRLVHDYTTIRLSEKCLRLWEAYDYGRSTTMGGLRLWRVYDYDTNRHKFRCKFIIKLYKRKILRKKEKKIEV